MTDGERKDLDRLVIRMGGRDFVAWHLIQALVLVLVGVAVGIYGLAARHNTVALVGGVLVAAGIATGFGR